MKKLIIIFYLICSVLGVKSQSELPKVVLNTIEGKSVNSESLKNNGKPFAICFWAVWNKSSLLELNNLMETRSVWHDELGTKLFAISIDEPERLPRAKAYLKVHQWECDVLFDAHGEMEKNMKINGVPHLILFDGNGKITWQSHDYNSGLEDIFINEIKKIKNTP